jgi:DNA-binding transcriptional MerR regulator/methylmalonyl-CoA mutase cobalamin-binding subunit
MTIQHIRDLKTLPSEGLIPIRTVSSLTGVNPVTLRAWERRYSLIKPVRTPKGHRLYTMHDVDLINQVVALLDAGMSIGQVGQVLDTDQEPPEPDQEDSFDPWSDYQRRLIQAITRFDEGALNEIYNEALSLYPVDIVISRLIIPLLRELGWRWLQQPEGRIAEEHFFSVFMRNKLGARFHHQNRTLDGPRLLAACMPGDLHELGILLFALAALDRNYPVVLLGANMPLNELPIAQRRTASQAIVLSGTAETPAKVIRKELPGLIQQVDVPVCIGGKVTLQYAKDLANAGVISLGDDFNVAFHHIEKALAKDHEKMREAL